MKRQIFKVDAQILDANGVFHVLDGFPVTFDSRTYATVGDDGIEKAKLRARGKLYETAGTMCKNDTRQIQTVVLSAMNGLQIEAMSFGAIEDVPDVEEEQ